MANWRLESVTLSGFRGIAGTQEILFSCLPALLHGNNGVGKSTVALGLQWVLYGEYPDKNLSEKDAVLRSIGADEDEYGGKVVLKRDNDTLVIERDSEGAFTLTAGGKKYKDAEAEAKRDELLGLDILTFIRAVLVQQGRIRGLLLDEPKERNRAMDRLLGMEALANICEAIVPKHFQEAAEEWEEKIETETDSAGTELKLLQLQYREAQEAARGAGFLNKELSPEGFKNAQGEVNDLIAALAKKHDVRIAVPAACKEDADADAIAEPVADNIRKIRLGSKLGADIKRIEESLSGLAAQRAAWNAAVKERDAGKKEFDELVGEHGTIEEQKTQHEGLLKRIKELLEDLTAAGLLRQLLVNALDYSAKDTTGACPVCERPLVSPGELKEQLKARIKALASDVVSVKEKALEKARKEVEGLEDAIEKARLCQKALKSAQDALDRRLAAVGKFLGAPDLKEHKIGQSLDALEEKLNSEKTGISAGLSDLEAKLEAIEKKERRLIDKLLPVLNKRAAVAAKEADLKKIEKDCETYKKNAKEMEQLASDMTLIKQAVLDTKDGLSKLRLDAAAKRAQELYSALVRHPVFKKLEISAARRSSKLEYSFNVSPDGKADNREARNVLSDGQMTAAAMALVYALAESASHRLDMIYVDDPTQNLDQPGKEAMAKVVAELASRRQVIVSTQDEDFVTLLNRENFKGSAVIHNFKSWDGMPDIKTTMPPGA